MQQLAQLVLLQPQLELADHHLVPEPHQLYGLQSALGSLAHAIVEQVNKIIIIPYSRKIWRFGELSKGSPN